MDSRLVDFATRHGQSTDPCVAAALVAARSGAVTLRSVINGASTRELAKTYAFRAARAAEQGRQSVAVAMRTLADRCEANPECSCSIWVLSGPSDSYALFELIPAQVVAGCLRFEGPIDEEQHAA
jgi:hypothetical protein